MPATTKPAGVGRVLATLAEFEPHDYSDTHGQPAVSAHNGGLAVTVHKNGDTNWFVACYIETNRLQHIFHTGRHYRTPAGAAHMAANFLTSRRVVAR